MRDGPAGSPKGWRGTGAFPQPPRIRKVGAGLGLMEGGVYFALTFGKLVQTLRDSDVVFVGAHQGSLDHG
jgi:hypothetical protein